jgi:RNA polymerase sigma-70 factor (ECF subfamily)
VVRDLSQRAVLEDHRQRPAQQIAHAGGVRRFRGEQIAPRHHDAYLRAFTNLAQLEDPACFSNWISRIVVHEAWMRLRRRRQQASLAPSLAEAALRLHTSAPDPEEEMAQKQQSAFLEAAIDALSIGYRAVFMMRDVEGMSVAETAECLGIKEGAVKTRLHRAHAALREEVWRRTGGPGAQPFRFDGARCDRIVACVLRRIPPADA